jgi:hypothetical protein
LPLIEDVVGNSLAIDVELWTMVDPAVLKIPVTFPVSIGNEVVCNSVFKTVEPLDANVVSDTNVDKTAPVDIPPTDVVPFTANVDSDPTAPVVIAPVMEREIVEFWTTVDSVFKIPVGNTVVCNSVFIEVEPLDEVVVSDTPNVELDSTIPVVIPPTEVVPFNADVDSIG